MGQVIEQREIAANMSGIETWLPPGWQLIASAIDAPCHVLAHPEQGMLLLDLTPDGTPRAEARLGQALARSGFSRRFGQAPSVWYVQLAPAQGPRFASLLTAALAEQPSPSVPAESDWPVALRKALQDDPAWVVLAARRPMRGRSHLLGLVGAACGAGVALGIAAAFLPWQPRMGASTDATPERLPALTAAAPVATSAAVIVVPDYQLPPVAATAPDAPSLAAHSPPDALPMVAASAPDQHPAASAVPPDASSVVAATALDHGPMVSAVPSDAASVVAAAAPDQASTAAAAAPDAASAAITTAPDQAVATVAVVPDASSAITAPAPVRGGPAVPEAPPLAAATGPNLTAAASAVPPAVTAPAPDAPSAAGTVAASAVPPAVPPAVTATARTEGAAPDAPTAVTATAPMPTGGVTAREIPLAAPAIAQDRPATATTAVPVASGQPGGLPPIEERIVQPWPPEAHAATAALAAVTPVPTPAPATTRPMRRASSGRAPLRYDRRCLDAQYRWQRGESLGWGEMAYIRNGCAASAQR